MARRTWHCYAKRIHSKPYVKKRGARGKEYVHGGADPKIRIYEMGDAGEDYDTTIGIQILNSVIVSDATLEAARTSVNRVLRDAVGKGGFHFKMRIHPYRVYRERKMMSFAGADRLQQGMRQSFGKPSGRCALIKAGQLVAECSTYMKFFPGVKKAMQVATYKFPRTCRLVTIKAKDDKIRNQVGLPAPLDP